jgi:hypothetical protein
MHRHYGKNILPRRRLAMSKEQARKRDILKTPIGANDHVHVWQETRVITFEGDVMHLQKALFCYFEDKLENPREGHIEVSIKVGCVTVKESAEVTLHSTLWYSRMERRQLSPEEEHAIADKIKRKVLAQMVPAPYDRILTIRINKAGRLVGMAISLQDEIAIRSIE